MYEGRCRVDDSDQSCESDSDSSDTDDGYTTITVNGITQFIPDEFGVTTGVKIPGMRNIQIGDGQMQVVHTLIHQHRRISRFQKHKHTKEYPIEAYDKHRKGTSVDAHDKHRKGSSVDAHGKHRKESPIEAHCYRNITDSKSQPTRGDLNHVCKNIDKQWKHLGSALGLTRGQIESIEIDFHIEGHYEMAYQTLLNWKRQNGGHVTVLDLAHALMLIGMPKLANEIPVK